MKSSSYSLNYKFKLNNVFFNHPESGEIFMDIFMQKVKI